MPRNSFDLDRQSAVNVAVWRVTQIANDCPDAEIARLGALVNFISHTVVVGFTAGSAPDIAARLTGQWLSERLGQQFVVENRPGGATNIATEAVVRAPPDGYTLLQVTSSNGVNAALYDKLNFNFIRDITPIANIIQTPGVMEVNPSVPARSISEFIAYAKSNPGKLNHASNSATTMLVSELFKTQAKVEYVDIGVDLEQKSFSFHHRFAGSGADIAQS